MSIFDFARALVRRLSYVAFVVIAGVSFSGQALAVEPVPNGACQFGNNMELWYCSKAEAEAACNVALQNTIEGNRQGRSCNWNPPGSNAAWPNGYYHCGNEAKTATCQPYKYIFPVAEENLCDPAGPPLTGGFMKYTGTEPGYQTCVGGCEYNPSSMTYQTGTVDGVTYVSLAGWIPSGASCTVGPNDEYTPPTDSDGDGSSDSNDQAPNNPGQDGGGPEGKPTEDSGSKDGGEQGNESGEGSGNGNTSGGGGNCASPPSSSGDAILAQIAYQAWATRCAVESAKDANGNLKTTQGEGSGDGSNGSDKLDVTNDLLGKIKDMVKKISDFVDGLGEEVDSLDTDKGADETALVDAWNPPQEQEDLDSSGLGWGHSCPQLPVVSVAGYTGSIDDGSLCTVMNAVGALILLLAYFQAAIIIGRS